MAIILKGLTMGAARVHDRTCTSLRRRLLLTAACSLGLLVMGQPATAQNTGQTIDASTLGGSTPNIEGGTIEVDKSGTYSNDFVLGGATSTQLANMIDAHGNQGTFSGIGADATAGVPGNLTIEDTVGGGEIIFTGVNTYSGPTTINSGATLALSSTGSISFSQYVLDNGTLDISGASAAAQIVSLAGSGNVTLGSQTLTITDAGVDANNVFTGTISGAGSLSISGGIEIIDGTNTYTGGTTITSGGALQIGNDDTAGSVVGNIANAGSLTFERTDAITFASSISGAGDVNEEYGSLTFTAAQPYTGATTIISGTLALSGSGSIANSSSLTDNGTFDISQTSGTSLNQLTGTGNVNLGAQTLTITTSTGSSGIFSGVIADGGIAGGTGGALVLSGSGTEILGGTNTYTGGTTVKSGTLQLGDGATTGTIIGNIANAGTVAFDYAGTQPFTGVISGTGAVTLINGVLQLSTAQTYTGLTTITAGTLQLTPGGSISASSGLVANGTFDISQTSGATIQTLSGSGIVELGANTLIINNASGTFTGVIQSTVAAGATQGGVTINGGTEILSGTGTYTGATTINSGATLSLTSLNSLAASPITIASNGTLDISGAINNLSNLVTVNVDSLSGAGNVTLGSNTLVIINPTNTTFAGIISGTGNLTISGGTETLTGLNTYSGTTTVASGATLILSGNGSLSQAAIADSGTLNVSAASAGVTFASLSGTGAVILGANSITFANASGDFGGTISGTGGLTVSGGIQILSGANTYTGGTSIASGATLQLGDGGTGGTVIGNIANAGTLAFNYSGSTTFGATITGAGGVNQLGGTTVLTGANSYSGGTTITAGTLQIGNGGTTGSISGNVADNGTLAFDHSDNVNFGGAISGSGGVSQLGTGTLVLSGSNTYTGTTTIASGGTLQLAGGNSLATSSNVADNGTFDVSVAASPQISSLSGSGKVLLGTQTLAITNGAGSFSGAISGTGGVTLSGGTQTLAGTNTYSGATTINGGTLSVTGSIANSSGVAVNSGGTLSGTGTVSSVTVASGGTVAPGSSGSGTLNVNGPVSFASGSNFLINASSAGSSELAATGSASLGGTISVASTNGTYLLGQKMTVLTAAGGVSGDFTAAALPNGANGAQFASLVSQDANDVYLTVSLSKLSPALPSGSTLNQTNAIAGVDAGIAHGDTLPQAFENLGNVSSSTLGTYAQQMAGELGGDVAQVGNTLFDPFQDAVFDHLADIGQQPRGARHAALQSGPDAWFSLLAGTNVVGADATAGAQKFSSSAVGFAGGADWNLNPNLMLGGALSVGSTHFRVGDGLGDGKATAYQFGLYGLVQYTPRIYGAFLAAISSDSINTTRTVTATETDTLSASPNSKVFDGRYETGVNLRWIKPYIAVEDRLLQSSAYSETGPSGASDFALSYASHTVNMPDVEIGFRNASNLPVARNWVLHLTDGFAFEHAANGSFDAQAAYTALPDSDFTTYGAQPGKNLAKVSLGAEFKSRYGLTAGLTFDDAVSSRSQSYNGIFSFGYGW